MHVKSAVTATSSEMEENSIYPLTPAVFCRFISRESISAMFICTTVTTRLSSPISPPSQVAGEHLMQWSKNSSKVLLQLQNHTKHQYIKQRRDWHKLLLIKYRSRNFACLCLSLHNADISTGGVSFSVVRTSLRCVINQQVQKRRHSARLQPIYTLKQSLSTSPYYAHTKNTINRQV